MSLGRWLLVAALALGGAASCGRRSLPGGTGHIDTGGAGGGGAQTASGQGGQSGSTASGAGGASGTAVAACAGASDPRLVIADQRILRLTVNQLLNTVRYLIDDTEATALLTEGVVDPRDSIPLERRFPPLTDRLIDSDKLAPLENAAMHVGRYVRDSFAGVTGCATPTDACATAYLDKLAARAYRRQLTPDEKTRFTALYARLRGPQTVNGYAVTFTVEEATSYAVTALLLSPQMLWRWEIGDPAGAGASPAGVPLTDAELATQLAFFLTDQPPDDALVAAAAGGTLRATLPAQVERLLASPTARDWLRTIIETYLKINTVPGLQVDPDDFPTVTAALLSDMEVEARTFLDLALWTGNLTDLLLSRVTFLNSRLAANIYMVPAPSGATPTSFVQATLPPAQRAGLLTSAGFLIAHDSRGERGRLVQRGMLVATVLLCMPYPGPDMPGAPDLTTRTSQEHVALRAGQPACNACHSQFDAYGLALEGYDAVARIRTLDEQGKPVDAHATLPAAAGGGTVASGVELAAAIATSPAFTNCMARTLLRHAMVDDAYTIDVPTPPQQLGGCATADVVQRYQSGGGKTFADLVRATAAAPAFGLRRAAP